MEVVLALLVFALLIVAWLVLPGSAITVEETQGWTASEALLTPAA